MDAKERALALENSPELEVTHQATAADPEAKSQAASSFNDDLHFNCFVCVDGGLYELDGRKNRPIYHGPTTPNTLLKVRIGPFASPHTTSPPHRLTASLSP